ncbi:MAG: hypothetical protein GEU28_11120 [Dehalococcoidia bacterium]|nr:hypothetical protein [Dehalococcoidia bacterium]
MAEQVPGAALPAGALEAPQAGPVRDFSHLTPGPPGVLRPVGTSMFVVDGRRPHDVPLDPLRLAILSTGRSGTSWLRLMLSELYTLDMIAGPLLPADVAWPNLPTRCLIQAHWYPPTFSVPLDEIFYRLPGGLVEAYDLRVVTVARHPFDTLVSALRFSALLDPEAQHVPLEANSPSGQAFLREATSQWAERTLAISREWWGLPGVLRVRYEDLVSDTPGELAKLVAAIGEEPDRTVAEVAALHQLQDLKSTYGDGLFWQGQPGLWRKLIPAGAALQIYEANRAAFETMGYVCDPDPDLKASEAEAAWRLLVSPSPK